MVNDSCHSNTISIFHRFIWELNFFFFLMQLEIKISKTGDIIEYFIKTTLRGLHTAA